MSSKRSSSSSWRNPVGTRSGTNHKFLRFTAQGAAWAYLAIAGLLFLLVAGEGDSSGNALVTLTVLAAPTCAALTFIAGISRPNGARGRAIRIAGWMCMAAASIALISFSFIIWPLLLAALPYAVVRE